MSDFSIPTQPADDAGFFDARPIVHYAASSRLTACGLSTDFALHTDEPETVAKCDPCLSAVAELEACPGGCSSTPACGCYNDGYNAGLSIAFGLRSL